MFKNFLKRSFRGFLKNKLYSTINILGLSISISVALGIFLFIKTELSYDAHHVNKERIFRVIRSSSAIGEIGQFSSTSGPLGPFLKKNFPQVKFAARYWGGHSATIKVGDKLFKENNIGYIDSDAMQIFTIPFVSGDHKSALIEPNSIVMREFIARKYFKNEKAIGQTLYLNDKAYTVSGIIQDENHLSHMKYNILLPFTKIESQTKWLMDWGTNAISTYIQLNQDTSLEELESQLSELTKRYDIEQVTLQPLNEIHLYSNHIVDFSNTNKGSIANVRIFSIITILLLVIACINYVNLTTAKSSQRANEIGMYKVCGSNRIHIIFQILLESIMISLISYFIALVLVQIWIAMLNPLINSSLSIQSIDYFYAFCVSIGAGVVAGLYPAFHFAQHKPLFFLSSLKSTSNKTVPLRKILVLLQFTISIVLISATLIVYAQRDFMQNKDQGFKKENVVCIPIRNNRERAKIDLLKQQLIQNSHIISVAATTQPAGNGTLSMTLTPKENQSPPVSMEIGSIDADYIPTIGMKIIIGRNFIPDNTGDINEGVILNQTACQKLGWEDPIGKEFEPIHGAFFNKSKMQVLGVVKDFHFSSLHSEIRPIAFLMIPDRYRHLIIRIQPGNLQRTIDEIQSVWTTTVPQSQFRFWFLDERLENQYRAEQKISQLLLYFALLVISISCLGLFGLAAFTAERRTKEIGIRKVNGAKISEILQMLNGDFIKWVAIAFVISVPLSYYAMNKWLENFAYKTTISWWIFALAGVLALGIALLTVSWQSWKAATRNPVEALRYE